MTMGEWFDNFLKVSQDSGPNKTELLNLSNKIGSEKKLDSSKKEIIQEKLQNIIDDQESDVLNADLEKIFKQFLSSDAVKNLSSNPSFLDIKNAFEWWRCESSTIFPIDSIKSYICEMLELNESKQAAILKEISKAQNSFKELSRAPKKMGDFVEVRGEEKERVLSFLKTTLSINGDLDLSDVYIAKAFKDGKTNMVHQSYHVSGELKGDNAEQWKNLSKLFFTAKLQTTQWNNATNLQVDSIEFDSLDYDVKEIEWGRWVVLDKFLAYERSGWTAKPEKQQRISLKYDEAKTRELIVKEVEKAPYTLDGNFDLLNKDLPRYMAMQEWTKVPRDFGKLLRQSLILDQNVVVDKDSYVRQISVTDGEVSKNQIPIEYNFSYDPPQLTLNKEKAGPQTVEVLGYSLPITLDIKNNRLDISIADADLLKFKEHMVTSYHQAYETLNNATFGNVKEFKRLDKEAYDRGEGRATAFSFNPGFLKLSYAQWFSMNVRSPEQPFIVNLTSENQDLQLADEYNNAVSSLVINDGSFFREIKVTDDKLTIWEKKGKKPDYLYIDPKNSSELKSAVKYFDTKKNVLCFSTPTGKVLTEIDVVYDEQKGYQLNKEKNRQNVTSEDFHYLLEPLYLTPGNKLWISKNDINNLFGTLFEHNFPAEEKKELFWAFVTGRFYDLETDSTGSQITLKEKIPEKVKNMINQISSLLTNVKHLGDTDFYYAQTKSDRKNKEGLWNFVFGKLGTGWGYLEGFTDWKPEKSPNNVFTYHLLDGENNKIDLVFDERMKLQTKQIDLGGVSYSVSSKIDKKTGKPQIYISPLKEK